MAIDLVNRVQFGTIPTTRDIEPRASVISPVPEALETTAQREQHAALVAFRAAGARGDMSRELADMGRVLLKPAEDLLAIRKRMQANDISIRGVRASRRFADFSKQDGTPHTVYTAKVEAEHTRLTTAALAEARPLGPAAFAQVAETMGQERLRLFGESSTYVMAREVDVLRGMWARTDTFAREEVLRAPEAEHPALLERYDADLDMMVQRGVIRADDAERIKKDFFLYTLENRAMQIGRALGFPAARFYLNRFTQLSEDQKRLIENNVHDAIRYDVQQAEEKDRRDAKIHQSTQDNLEAQAVLTITSPHATTEELLKLENDVVRMSTPPRDDLRGEQSTRLVRWSEERRDKILKPQPDNEESLSDLVDALGTAPEHVTYAEIMDKPGISPDTRNRLNQQRLASNDKNHFTNSTQYKAHLAMFDDVAAREPPALDIASRLSTGQPLQMTLRMRVGQYKDAYMKKVAAATRHKHYTATDAEIATLFDGWVQEAIATLMNNELKKPKPQGGSTKTWDDLAAPLP